MSIRGVHILFIVVSTITLFGFGAWGFVEYQATDDAANLALGIGSVAAGLALVFYGTRFFKKLKDLKTMKS